MIHLAKKTFFVLTLILFISGCGGSDGDEVTSGGGESGTTTSASTSADSTASSDVVASQGACTGQDLMGVWRVTLTVGDITQSDTFTFDGSESPGGNVLSFTEDGVTLMGDIAPTCDSASGTATNGTLSGTFTAEKIS